MNFFTDDEEEIIEVKVPLEVKNVINNDKSELSTELYSYTVEDTIKINTDGLESSTGIVKRILKKSSKFIDDYYIYLVEYTDNGKLIHEWFFSNEIVPMDVEVTKRKRKKNYINNRDLLRATIAWQEELKINPKTPISKYMAECFIKLADNIGHSNWNHTEREDMKQHALLICCLYAKNFDIERSINAFSYFSRYIKNAFAQIHNRQKEFIDFRFELIKDTSNVSESYDYRERDDE